MKRLTIQGLPINTTLTESLKKILLILEHHTEAKQDTRVYTNRKIQYFIAIRHAAQ